MVSFSNIKIIYRHSEKNDVEYPPLLIVNVVEANDSIVMSIKREKVEETLIKNVINVLKKL